MNEKRKLIMEENNDPSDVPAADEYQNQNPFPRLELLRTMQAEAESLIAARNKSIVVHHAKNIVSAGNIVERSVREVLYKRLPKKYHVGQGHLVNPLLMTSPQFDIIISDNDRFPILFTDENGTEWFLYESVYAVGEVKSTYDRNKKQIEGFSENISRTKTEFHWPKRKVVANVRGKNAKQAQNAVSIDQLFSFMIFVSSGDFKVADLKDLYSKTPINNLPNLIYFVDRGVLLNMKFNSADYPMEMNLYPEAAEKIGLVDYKSKWCFRAFRDEDEEIGLGVAFFTFFYLLMTHLGNSDLPRSSLLSYYALSATDVGTGMYLDILE
jgi:hypothetical protein